MNEKFNEWIKKKMQSEVKASGIDTDDVINFITNVKELLFPGILEKVSIPEEYYNEKINSIKLYLTKLLYEVESIEEIKLDKEKIVTEFFNSLPEVEEILNTDIEAIYDGDPACKSTNEVVLCYPGFSAIFVHRIAHVLVKLNVSVLPRVMSEYAHSTTGIDIHPGANIARHFFIDHGTGIVIGETCDIGEHVKIYQGVTLGALSLSKGHALNGSKRHPTIKNNVTIYSGASIFGGDTVIGENTTIGSSAFIVSSVDRDMIVTINEQIKKRTEE